MTTAFAPQLLGQLQNRMIPLLSLQMGRPRFSANSRTHLQISNPKRAFFLRRQEVDPKPLLQEMGLPAAVEGVADDITGYLNLQCEFSK